MKLKIEFKPQNAVVDAVPILSEAKGEYRTHKPGKRNTSAMMVLGDVNSPLQARVTGVQAHTYCDIDNSLWTSNSDNGRV